GPAYGRRVSDRAITGARPGASKLVRLFVFLIPGGGSYPSSTDAGLSFREEETYSAPTSPAFSPGGRGFLRSTDVGLSFREEETYSAPTSPALGSGGWRISKLCTVGIGTRCLNSMKLSAVRLRVEEKFGFGGGSPYLSSDETRCTVVVLRRCSDAAMVKSRRR
ncbi:hypothetical protein HID58_043491, partial [Brassica napus]